MQRGWEGYVPLFEAILEYVPVRDEDPEGPLQLQICSLDYSSYVGKIGVGRIHRGRVRPLQDVVLLHGEGSEPLKVRVNQVLSFEGLERVLVEEAEAGDIVLNQRHRRGEHRLHAVPSEHPRRAAAAQGRRADADHELSRQRLAARRARGQVRHQPAAARAARARDQEQRRLAGGVPRRYRHLHRLGAGELHLTILLENMRREGYELAVSRPRVVYKTSTGYAASPTSCSPSTSKS